MWNHVGPPKLGRFGNRLPLSGIVYAREPMVLELGCLWVYVQVPFSKSV